MLQYQKLEKETILFFCEGWRAAKQSQFEKDKGAVKGVLSAGKEHNGEPSSA